MCGKIFYVVKNTWKLTILVMVEKLWVATLMSGILVFLKLTPNIH